MPKKKTDPSTRSPPSRDCCPACYLVANNQDTGGRCLQWLRDMPRPPRDRTRGFDALTALAGAGRPGSGDVLFTPWLAGERSPVDDRRARGGFHNLSLPTTRAEMVARRARGRGLQLPLALRGRGALRRPPARPDPGASGAGRSRPCGARSTPTSSTGTIEQVADRCTPTSGAAPVAALALGEVSTGCAPVAGAGGGHPAPIRRGVGGYDRLFAEFPGLYRAQRGLFHRLNAGGR